MIRGTIRENIPATEIKDLCLLNKCPPYRGTGLDLRKVRLNQADEIKEGLKDSKNICVYDDDHPDTAVLIAQFREVDYLTKHFGKKMYAIGNIVSCSDNNFLNHGYGYMLALYVSRLATEDGATKLVSVSIPAENMGLIQVFEEWGFGYREGFLNMVSQTTANVHWRNLLDLRLKKVCIRKAGVDELREIEEWYLQSKFPSRFATEKSLNQEAAMRLYAKRFTEVYERGPGEVYVMFADEKPIGAIIYALNDNLMRRHGIKTNLLSGMGMIVSPERRRMGVGSALVLYRQGLYAKDGVQWVSLGANINNRPMVQCLEGLGFRYGCTDISMAKQYTF